MGQQGSQKQHQSAKAEAGFQCNASDASDGRSVSLPPILSDQHAHGIADGNGDLLNKELYLIYGGRTGQRSLTIAAQHDIICNIDGIGQNVLQRYNEDQAK